MDFEHRRLPRRSRTFSPSTRHADAEEHDHHPRSDPEAEWFVQQDGSQTHRDHRQEVADGRGIGRAFVSDDPVGEVEGDPRIGSEPPGPCLDVMLEACAAAGFNPNFVARSEDYATAQGFVAAGLGVALIPRLGLGSRRSGVVLRRVREPEPVRTIYAAVREATLAQPALRTLLDALQEIAKQ